MAASKFIDAYNTLTGEKVRVPEHYVDLFENIAKTPKAKAADKATAAKTTTKES